MVSPESLVRLRPGLYRLFMIATAASAVIGLASIVTVELAEGTAMALVTTIVIAFASICALTSIAYVRRRERTGPALFGLALTALTTIGVLATTWISDDEDILLYWSAIGVIWTVAWAFVLAIYIERISASFVIIQHATALAMAALATALTIMILSGPEARRAEFWSAIFAVASLAGMLIVTALAHLQRSGVRALVPMAHVASVLRAMDFYQQLGFRCENSFMPPEAPEPTWAWMETPGGAKLMLVCAEEPVIAAQQGVLFYVYCDDLPTKHAELTGKGIEVGPIERPFYAPRGECLLKDPDGYSLMLTHT